MKNIYSLFLIVFCISWYGSLNAQTSKTIQGTIYDNSDRLPLVGVSIFFTYQGTLQGVSSDLNGNYQINVPSDVLSLTASLVGYESKNFAIIGNQLKFDLYLIPSAALNEVVVTALGLEREYQNLGFSLQQVRGEDISEVKSVNFLDNLSGRIAGVTVSQGSSGVGSTSRISIRGESSFTNNNPLFVLDGLPINNLTLVNITDDTANGFMEVDFGNGAMDINSDDIESVTVLKGPSAAALYGARAANGVILLTSKKAQQEGISVSINSSTFFERPFRLPRFQNEFGQGNSGVFEFRNGLGGGINDNITFSFGPRLNAGLLIPQFDSPVILGDGRIVRGADTRVHGGLPITPTPFVSNPNNLRDFYELGLTTINNVSLAGGSETFSSRFSVTDVASRSYIPGTDLNRRSFVGSFNYKPLKGLSVASNFNLINSSSTNRPATKYGSENINYSIVAWMGRQTDMRSLRQYWQPGFEGLQQYSYNYTFFDNPYFTLLENRNGFERNRLIGNAVVTYELNNKFSFFVRSGTEIQNEDRTFRRAFSSNRFPLGAYAEQNLTYRETNTDFLATYKDSFGDFSLDFSIGANRIDQEASMEQLQTLQLSQPGIFTLANAASPLQYFQSYSRKRINSIYAFARTSYKNFLFVDITSRTDWSSALANEFGTNTTSFSYPSVSSSLVLSNVMQLPLKINFLKVRASYAEVGNDSAPFQTIGNFVSRTPVYSSPTFGDQSVIPNANLRPERISSWEFGTDVRFLSNKIGLDVTYFNMLTSDQIISLPIPISSGYERQNVNGGAVRTFGFEAIVDYKAIRTQKFFWNIQANYTRYINRVESLPSGAFTLAYNRIYDNVNQTVWYIVSEGGRLGDMWGTGYLRNENGDFIINSQGGYITDNTLIKLGNVNPDFMVGVTNYFKFKQFHLSALVDIRRGGQIVSRTTALAGAGGQLIETVNRPAEGIIAPGVVNVGSVDNPVFVPNTQAIPAETFYRQFFDRNNEENNTIDADFIKLRELSIGMDVPLSVLKNKAKLVNVSLIGRNLLMLSKVKHFDPEQVSFQGQNVLGGVEDMAYPTARSIGFKIGMNF